jgi:hypothetical protein
VARKTIPVPEVSESDFGAFEDAAREYPAPIRDEELREFLQAVHERAQEQRFGSAQ